MRIHGNRFIAAIGLLLGMATQATLIASAEEMPAKSWADVKCERYKKAWADASTQLTRQGLSADFVTGHDAFLASNCSGKRNVCPRSEQELLMANVLVIKGMNAGFASTFFPFACRSQTPEWRESVDPRHRP